MRCHHSIALLRRGYAALAACLAVAAWAGGLRAASPFAFAPAGGYGVGMSPSAVVVGDFSGDQRPDLIGFWTDGQGAFLCLAGQGDGTFATPGALYSNFTMRHGAAGDFNGDGRLDLLAVNAGFPFARVLLGGGNGTFSNPTTVFLTGNPFSGAVADFNGDGRLDAAVSLPTAIGIFLGNGLGGLTTFTNTLTGYDAGFFQTFVATGDFNNDGKADLASLTSVTNIVAVLIGNGNGTFRAPAHYLVGDFPNHLALSDLNNDGRLDLVTANTGSGTVSVRLGAGNGTFTAALTVDAAGFPYAVAVADFNGDGRPDLVTANRALYAVTLFGGNGNGTFGAPTNFNVGGQPVALAVADFNGDGKPDLATANNFGDSLGVLMNETATPAPVLSYRPLPSNRLELSWSRFGTALFQLETSTDLAVPESWTNSLSAPLSINERYVVTYTNDGAPRMFFRLRTP